MVAGALGVAFHYQHVVVSFLSGLVAIFLLWAGYAFILQDERLLDEMAELLSLSNPFWLVLISGLLGGLLAGFAAAAGSSLRQLIAGQPTN